MEIQQINLGQVAFNPKGSWNADATYKRLNVVYYKGRSYYAKQDNTNQPPSMQSEYWGLMVDGGDVTNNPDEEDVTSMMDEDGKSVIKFADRAYDPERFSGKGYKILRKNMQNVRLAVVTINVTKAPTADGELSVTINNIDTHITLSATDHNTTALTAQAIADALTPEHEDYDVEVSDSTVKLTRKFGEDVPASAYDVAATGMELTVEDSVKTDRRNIITQVMISKPNTIYEIRYDFDLNGGEIEVPENCTLKFEGGMLRNGTVKRLLLLAGRLNKVFDCIKVVDSDTQGFVPVNAFVNLKDTFSNFRCVEINEDIKIDGDIYLDSWQEVRGHNTNLSLNGTIFLGHSCKVGGLNINQRSSADIPTLCVALSHLNKTYINNKYDKIFRDNKWFSNLTIEDLALTSSNSIYVGKGIEFVNDGCDVGFWGASIRNIRIFGTFKYAITVENSLDSPVGWFTDLNFENIKISQSYIGVYIIGKKLYGFIFDKISMQMTKTTPCMFKLEGGSGNITNIIPWDYPESTNPVYVINPNYIGEYSLDVADNHTETGVIYEMSEEIKSNRILSFNFNFKNLENGLDVSQVHLFQNMDESVRFTYKDFLTLPSNNITCSDKDTSIVILKKLGLFDSLSLRSYDTLRLFFTVNRAYDSKVINLYVFNDTTNFVYNFVTVTTSSYHNAYNATFQPAYNMLPDIGDINNKNDINGAILDNTIFLNKGNICIKKDGNILDAKGYNVLYERDIIDKTELLSIMLQKSETFKNQKYGYKFTYHSYENEDKMYLQLMKSSLGYVVDANGFGVVFLDPSFSLDEVNQIFRNAMNRTRGIVLYGVYDFNGQTISANGIQYVLLGENCNMNNGRIICNGSIVKSKTTLKTNLIFQGANYVDRSVYHIPSYVSRIEELDKHCEEESFGEFALDRKTSRTFFKNGQLWVDALGRPYNKAIIGTTSQRPSNVSEGFEFYDTTLKKKILWNGTAWVNMDGTDLE